MSDDPPDLHPKRRENPDATCPRHPDKDIRRVVQAAWDAGWWCERKRTNYIVCRPPGGRKPVLGAEHAAQEGEPPQEPPGRVPPVRPGRLGGRVEHLDGVECDAMGASSVHEHDVRLELRTFDDLSDDVMEERMLDVLQAVEERASDVALGAVASTDLDERTIALVFQVAAERPDELFEQISYVVKVIGEGAHLGVKRASVEDHVLVGA